MKTKGSGLVPPLGSDAAWAAGWTPAEGRLAVDQHKRGTFRWSWQLTIDAPSYPPIKAALEQRLASPCGLPWTVEGPGRAPARFETEAAQRVWTEHLQRLVRSTLKDLSMMGFSVWHHPLSVDADTLRTEIAPFAIGHGDGGFVAGRGGVQRWPLSAVGYTADPLLGVIGYYAIAQGGQRIQLPRPGESSDEWTVVGEGDQPHLDGAINAIDMCFTAGMLGWRARANLGKTAGRASPIGYMPPSMAVAGDEGKAAQDTLAGIGTEASAALFPNAFKLDKFELTTTGAADFFHTELLDTILLVALAVMGRGGALAKTDAQYQGPTEMDVPESLVRRDVGALERAATGLFAMLARMNAGPEGTMPTLCGHLPDADQETSIQDYGKRRTLYLADLAAQKVLGIHLTQDEADKLATKYRVEPVVWTVPVQGGQDAPAPDASGADPAPETPAAPP